MIQVTGSRIADLLGVHWSTVSRWRNGSRVPSPDTLNRMVKLFDLDASEALEAYAGGPPAFSRYFCEVFTLTPEPVAA